MVEHLGPSTPSESPDTPTPHIPLGEDGGQLRMALRELCIALIAIKPHLDKPYPERPEWTPWTRFIERPFMHAGAALAATTPVYDCGTDTPGVCAWNPTCMSATCAGRSEERDGR